MDKARLRGILFALGPGIIWAGAAVGVSHIVQSTRAGAVYGYALVWAVLAANILKYPAFEFGPRYAAATGESLIEGYDRLGRPVLWLYVGLTLLTMFSIQAGVTSVAAVMINAVLGDAAPALPLTGALVLLVCAALLAIGNYPLLDKTMKVVMIALTISTIAAWTMTLGITRERAPGFVMPDPFAASAIMFTVALMGWMPSAIDISVWHSLWTLGRRKETAHAPTVKEALVDFNIGYVTTAVLSLFFLGLGANLIFGSGEEVRDGSQFGVQLFGLYTNALGQAAFPLIAVAAVTTMFSTTMTCFDAFPRVLSRVGVIVSGSAGTGRHEPIERRLYWILLVVLFGGTSLILFQFGTSIRKLVDLATTLSFMTAPALAILNHRLITSRHTPADARPPLWLQVLSIVGIVSLTAFCLLYVKVRFLSGT